VDVERGTVPQDPAVTGFDLVHRGVRTSPKCSTHRQPRCPPQVLICPLAWLAEEEVLEPATPPARVRPAEPIDLVRWCRRLQSRSRSQGRAEPLLANRFAAARHLKARGQGLLAHLDGGSHETSNCPGLCGLLGFGAGRCSGDVYCVSDWKPVVCEPRRL